MLDVYGSLGSAQSSKCASSSILGKDFLTSSPPSYLGQAPGSSSKPFPWGWVALGGLAVAGGALLLYSGEIGAGLAANPRAKRKANDEYSPFPTELLPGGRAAGMRPSDFDPAELARGTEHELEHTDDWRLAREIASDHLAEDEAYYQKLDAMERDTFRDNPLLRELTLGMTDPKVRYVAFIREAPGLVWSASFANKRDAKRWVEANDLERQASIEPWPPKNAGAFRENPLEYDDSRDAWCDTGTGRCGPNAPSRDNPPKLQWLGTGSGSWARGRDYKHYRLVQRAQGEWLVYFEDRVVGAERTPALAKRLAQEYESRSRT